MNFELYGFSFDYILIFASSFFVLSVLLSRVSSQFGVPALLIFLFVGMLAGSEGIGSLAFDDYSLSYAIGSVCLAFILFDGGLRTPWNDVTQIIKVGSSLSFFGTILTGTITGLFSHFVLGLGLKEGLLVGGITSSTDAAAVFSILRSKGLSLKGKLKQILEFEAGSNDPVAVFFTIVMISLISSQTDGVGGIILLFAQQTALGLGFGYFGARAMQFVVNHAGIEFEGLYGVLITGFVIVLFSAASTVGGSGFLAVYCAGLFLGKFEFLHKGSIVRFLDGIAWTSQITIFLVLGLLVFPSRILTVWKEGLIFAFFMMFVARPISVFIASQGSGLKKNERVFISWIGLRGAAPIILATLPWVMNIPKAEYYFDLVFFTVVVSVIFQGISIPWIASKLKVSVPLEEIEEKQKSGLDMALPGGFIAFDAVIGDASKAFNKKILELGLPEGTLLTSIKRQDHFVIPQGDTQILIKDKVSGFAREGAVEELESIFGNVHRVDL